MKRFFTLIAFALLASACTGQTERSFSFYDQHCREHAADTYAEEFAPQRYNECMDLHSKGIVLSESSDQHLAVAH